MLEALLQPVNLLVFVLAALWLGHPGFIKAPGLRRVLFFLFNAAILGWVLGRWRGLAVCLLYIGAIGWSLRFLGPDRRRSAWWCAGLICVLVAGLAATKYCFPTGRGAIAVRHIWLTLNISFLTFRLIHVVLDTHDGLIKRPDWLAFLSYAFFAPTSVAGPIQRYQDFHSQFESPKALTGEQFLTAIQRLVLGIAKKVFIASPLTPYVLGNMEPSGPHPLLLFLLACSLFSVQIYADFSGYTDIAIGCAAFFGIILPENFNRPWLATNLQDFWNRWHMTLTAWLRTYLFYPLNKFLTHRFPQWTKRGNPVLAILVTFGIAGIWHGNLPHYLVFGLMHGVGIAAYFLLRKKPSRATAAPALAHLWLARAGTFAYVSLAWIPFVYRLEEIPWLLGEAIRG